MESNKPAKPLTIKDRFLLETEDILVEDNISPQMKDQLHLWAPRKLFNKAQRVLSDIESRKKKFKLKKGLDFGCGAGGAVVLGTLYGYEMTGLEIDVSHRAEEGKAKETSSISIDECNNLTNPFATVHDLLGERGYNIVRLNTNAFPWDEFEDDSFDFVTAYRSLFKDEAPPREGDDITDNFRSRLLEIARIVRPKGVISVVPMSNKGWIRDCEAARVLLEQKKIKLCGKDPKP